MTTTTNNKAHTRFLYGEHISDEEAIALRNRFKAVVTACTGFPEYAVVLRDAVQYMNRLDSMLDARRAAKKEP